MQKGKEKMQEDSLPNHDEVSEDVADPEYEDNEEIGDDNEIDEGEDEVRYERVEEVHVQLRKEKNVRGPTKMRWITATQGKAKIYVKINRYGQPCGLKTCNFTNYIAFLVKSGDLSLMHKDWRKVKNKKIWDIVNKYFTIDPICEGWVMASASKKWRDFKNTLKRKYFDENRTEEENVELGCDKWIPTPEWKWLVNHWCQETTKARFRQNKQVRANQATALHTCGSRSCAVISDQLEGDLGRETSRAKMYIVTDTKANGQSLNEECQDKDVIRDRIENDHSLAVKTVDDGDLYADLFPKEQKGRIRGLGLLPNGSKSISLARTIAAMKQMEEENVQLKARMESAERRAELNEQNYNELRRIVHSLQGSSPRVGSVNTHTGSLGVGFSGVDIGDISGGICHGEEPIGVGNEEGSVRRAARSAPTNILEQSTSVDKTMVGPSEHRKTTVHPNRQEMAKANGQKLRSSSSDNVVHVNKLGQTGAKKVGRELQNSGVEVALRSPSSSHIVAYGRLGRTNKTAKGMDGLPLGEFYEVFVDVVVDTQVTLPRPQGLAIKLGAAIGRYIAWPFQNVIQMDGSPLNMLKRPTDCRE